MSRSSTPSEQSDSRIPQCGGVNVLKYSNKHDTAHPVNHSEPISFLKGLQPCSSRLLNSSCHELIIRTVHLLFCNDGLPSGGLLLGFFFMVMEGNAYFQPYCVSFRRLNLSLESLSNRVLVSVSDNMSYSPFWSAHDSTLNLKGPPAKGKSDSRRDFAPPLTSPLTLHHVLIFEHTLGYMQKMAGLSYDARRV